LITIIFFERGAMLRGRETMPRRFFDNHVRGNYEDWARSQLDERLAKNMVNDLNNMAERVFHHWQQEDSSKIGNATRTNEYRNYLAAQECGGFALVRDVADAHKHVVLDRTSRQVTHSDQTGPGNIGWDEGRWDETAWDSPPELIIVLDDGSKRPLRSVAENVMRMWENLLGRWGL
jgi:hypothetical protein